MLNSLRNCNITGCAFAVNNQIADNYERTFFLLRFQPRRVLESSVVNIVHFFREGYAFQIGAVAECFVVDSFNIVRNLNALQRGAAL